jgi:hypothetical protein
MADNVNVQHFTKLNFDEILKRSKPITMLNLILRDEERK